MTENQKISVLQAAHRVAVMKTNYR